MLAGRAEWAAPGHDPLIGRAAFETAKRMYPRDLIECERGAQIIEHSDTSRCSFSAPKLSTLFGSESIVVLTRQAEHMRAGLRCTLSGVIQLIAGYCTACGRVTLGVCMRLQSRPSRRALNCAADKRITPSCTRGRELAPKSALGVNTIRRAEVGEGTALTVANDLAVRRALEAAGVEFIDANGGGPGVRLPENKS